MNDNIAPSELEELALKGQPNDEQENVKSMEVPLYEPSQSEAVPTYQTASLTDVGNEGPTDTMARSREDPLFKHERHSILQNSSLQDHDKDLIYLIYTNMLT